MAEGGNRYCLEAGVKCDCCNSRVVLLKCFGYAGSAYTHNTVCGLKACEKSSGKDSHTHRSSVVFQLLVYTGEQKAHTQHARNTHTHRIENVILTAVGLSVFISTHTHTHIHTD